MEQIRAKARPTSRSHTVAFVGLAMALFAVSSWLSIPIGPVPITMQVFAVALIAMVLPPAQACASVAGFLLLGAIGLPVFSGMRGGVGVLVGPTGGFLWGYLIGAGAAALIVAAAGKRGAREAQTAATGGKVRTFLSRAGVDLIAGLVFMLITYLCGWAQFVAVSQMDPVSALLVSVAPFVLFDLIKIAVAASIAPAIRLRS